MEKYKNWVKTRDLYKNWLSKFLSDNLINKEFIYKNFNILQITFLVKQDNETRNNWFKNIHFRLNGVKIESKKLHNKIYFIFRFLTYFFFEILKFLLIKFSFNNSNSIKDKNTIYFHSLSSNLRINDGVCYDRHFYNSPNLDLKHNLKTVYLITIIPSFYELFKFGKYVKELNFKLKSLDKDYLILNHYVSFKNIISIYFSLFKKWVLFRKNNNIISKNETFEINQINFSDIILKEIENSFLGEIQFGLIYGTQFEKFLNKILKNNVIITYGETLSPMRAVYHFSNKIKNNVRFISIQHSVNNKNKIAFVHGKNDFMKNNKYNYSLIPDYYLLHGPQSKKITTVFYPKDRTKIIGCLKYDDFLNKIKMAANIKKKVYNIISQNDKKILLVTPSLNDFKELILVFSNINILSEWRIILSLHPATSKQKVNQFIAKLNLKNNIEIFEELKTNDLFFVSDLILCGYSSSIYEAIALGKHAVQYCDMKNPPIFEPDDKIPFFENKNVFWNWFDNLKKTNKFIFKTESDYVESTYFYKFDGMAANRLWDVIDNVNKNLIK